MTDLFLDVLNASFAASWVVLAVILARLALKKAPRWMVCGLWALVALRLLMPLMPEAPFSLIPSSEIIPPQSLYDTAPVIDSGVGFIDNAVNPVYTESLRPMPGTSVNPLQIWLAVFANLWWVGMIAMAVWALVSCLRVRRQLRERVRLNGNVYLCDRVASPFIFGLLRPILYLPSSLDEATQGHVIAHENAHIARRDHWWKPIGFLLLTINWFNPLMWLGYILLCRDIEMACDERVAKELSVEEKKAYSRALLSCSIRSRCVTVCPLAFGEVGVKMRVKSVLHYKKPALWVLLVTAVLMVVLAAGLLTDPVKKASELRYNGQLYVLEHQEVSFLPVQEETIGTLRSILHNTTEHPMEELQATNLDESLTGCPLYLEENRIYLHKYDGTCIAFALTDTDPQTHRTFTIDHTTFTLDLLAGWETETINGLGYHGFRFREKDNENGWVTVKYWPDLVTMYKYSGTIEKRIFPSGLAGEIYYLPDSEPWDWHFVFFWADHSSMTVERPENCLWSREYFDQAMEIIGTITVSDNGIPLFVAPAASGSAEADLGITLSVQNVTPNGATLLCTQDGTLWSDIITGSAWSLDQWTEDGWVSIMPEKTAWTTIAYLVNQNSTIQWDIRWDSLVGELGPGRYRIGKHFTGERRPPVTLDLPNEEVSQTIYAEFTIE